jgi:hypothetical protein
MVAFTLRCQIRRRTWQRYCSLSPKDSRQAASRKWGGLQGEGDVEVANAISGGIIPLAAMVSALATVMVAIAAQRQLPLISQQVSKLSEQVRLAREAEESAARRTREWETLKAVERYDADPIIDAATERIFKASEEGTNYRNGKVSKRDVICVLNYLDGLATGMEQELYIEAMIRDHMSGVFRHAVENYLHPEIIIDPDIPRVKRLYYRWFPTPPPASIPPPIYISPRH